jgi:hypothetical protein
VSPPSKNLVRRSLRLKVKGLNRGASKNQSQTISGSSILAQFPFSRFTHDEIIELLCSFRIQLGKDEAQRDIIINRFQNMQRDSFNSLVNQLIDHSYSDSFETITLSPLESDDTQFVIE